MGAIQSTRVCADGSGIVDPILRGAERRDNPRIECHEMLVTFLLPRYARNEQYSLLSNPVFRAPLIILGEVD